MLERHRYTAQQVLQDIRTQGYSQRRPRSLVHRGGGADLRLVFPHRDHLPGLETALQNGRRARRLPHSPEVLLYARLLFTALFEVDYLAWWDYRIQDQPTPPISHLKSAALMPIYLPVELLALLTFA